MRAAGRSWSVRVAEGTEVHLAGQLDDQGLALPRQGWAAVGRIKVTAVPKEGWRRFFEYAVLERESGGSRAGGRYSAVQVRYRLAG